MRLAFYKGSGTLYDAGIRMVTHGPYAHCEIIFGDDQWFTSSPRDGGVRFKAIVPQDGAWDFLSLSIQEDTIRDWCATQIGLKYDWTGVTRFVLPFVPPSKNHWFCSEICIAALQRGGILMELTPSRYSPNDLYQIAQSLIEPSTQLSR